MTDAPSLQPLAGRVALVTGASRGIGRDVALACAAAGADVACTATEAANAESTAEAIRAMGRQAVALGCRMESAAQVAELVAAAEAALGPVDLLVNNAGIAQQRPTLELSEADYDAVFSVNARAVFLCSQGVVRRLKALERGGAIVNIGSIAAGNAFPNRLAYCGSKAAVHHMTRVMAIEWAELGVRVNCVAPGYILTDIVAEMAAKGIIDEAGLAGRAPQRRLGSGQDIASAVVYLATEGAAGAGFVTGSTLTVDGGWDAYGYV